jgi:dimethylargininase
MGFVTTFNAALVREPAPSVVDGLRAGAHEGPDYCELLREHRAYVAALETAGLIVETLPPLPQHPDSVFVEDAAFVIAEGALVLRPGAPSREAEGAAIAPTLGRYFGRVATLAGGRVDGGDILILPGEILIGLSERTDRAGAEAFQAWARSLDRKVRIVEPPAGLLHLKTGCSLIDEETVLATPEMAEADLFGGLQVLRTCAGEEGAANVLRINDWLLVSDDYPRTASLLADRGLAVVPLATRQIEKLDAGLSCMSLRWSRS